MSVFLTVKTSVQEQIYDNALKSTTTNYLYRQKNRLTNYTPSQNQSSLHAQQMKISQSVAHKQVAYTANNYGVI